MKFPCLFAAVVCVFAVRAPALVPPKVNDPALRIELIATVPEVEACATVCSDPAGAIYVGNDPRDGQLKTKEPVCTIVRFGAFESADLVKLPDGSLAPPGPARRKRTVFANKLYSPAGSAWHDGWLYVIHDPLMSRFKDADGDGIAELREDLITNLGIAPNEGLNDHVVSGFTLGMDGFFYISVGDRGVYQAKSARDGSMLTMQGGGIIRCRTDGTQLEIFSTGTRNHLSVNLDAEDNAFTRDNTDDGNGWWTRLTHHIEGGYYGYPYDYRNAPNYGVTQPSEQTLSAIKQHGVTGQSAQSSVLSAQKSEPSAKDESPPDHSTLNSQPSTLPFLPAMADFGGGSPTGGLCYLSDGLPEKYRGKHFFSEWGKAGIFVTEVARDGATFKLVSDTKLVEAEKGGEFRPMQIAVAADGSLLIADWGYGGWKGPKVAGAIWRLYWPDARPASRLKDESKATVEELFAALGHPDRDQRLRAGGALVGKGEAVIEKLAALINDATAPNMPRVHSVWIVKEMLNRAAQPGADDVFGRTRFGDNEPLPTHLYHAFKAQDARVRAQGARAIGQNKLRFQFELLAPSLHDDDPTVRMQGAVALGRTYQLCINHVRVFGADETDHFSKAIIGPLVDALGDPDVWVRFAARKALERAGDWKTVGVAPIRLEKAEVRDNAWLALGEVHDDGALKLVMDAAKDADAQNRTRAVAALGRIAYQPKPYDGHWWGTQPVKSPPPLQSVAWEGTPKALAALTVALGDEDAGVRLAAAKAFTQFTLGGTRSGASQTPAGAPKEAADPPTDQGLAGASPSEALVALRARLTAETEPAVRRQLVEALGVQKDAGAVEVLRQIALDEKAAPDFRETAIGAMVNIGGDPARQTLALLTTAELSPRATVKVLEAVGALKVVEAAGGLLVRLQSPEATVRVAAAKAAGALGAEAAAKDAVFAAAAQHALVVALGDRESKVQVAAIEALGALKMKAAVPALIALAEKNRAKREVLEALARMPDERAIPVLVESLREKNTSVRRLAIKALKVMREKALPQVETLLASGRVPNELVPEIRRAFESGTITKWKLLGVFENVWDAVHPPEKDALAAAGVVDLARKYHNAEGKDVGWLEVTTDSEVGHVDLEKIFKTNAMVCAYATAEIDASEAADAKLFTSADDELAIWVNGRQVLNEPGNHGFEPDQNETPVQLHAGKNRLFAKIGNKGGGWAFHARIPGFDNGRFIKSQEPAPEGKQRAFALATHADGSWTNPGSAAKGEKLFFDPAAGMGAICATCHAVGGKGGQIGPDLSAVAANYKRADLITSIHEPSKTIALGFEQVMLETKSGETFLGALRSEAGGAFTVLSADGKSHVIPRADVKTRTAIAASLMPAGLTVGLKPEEFADLLAYLETLRGK